MAKGELVVILSADVDAAQQCWCNRCMLPSAERIPVVGIIEGTTAQRLIGHIVWCADESRLLDPDEFDGPSA